MREGGREREGEGQENSIGSDATLFSISELLGMLSSPTRNMILD